jgi:hypothetical protein
MLQPAHKCPCIYVTTRKYILHVHIYMHIAVRNMHVRVCMGIAGRKYVYMFMNINIVM